MKKALLIFALVCLSLTTHAQTNPPAGSNLANVAASSWTNTTGSLTTTGISDPNGGTNAGRLSNGASQATTFAVHSLSQTVAVGDVLMAGVWTRINSGSAGTGFPGTISASGCTATYAATGYSSTLALPATTNTSSWSWTSVAVKVITVSNNPCSLSLSLVSAASAATDFYAPVFFYVPVGTMQDNQILLQSQKLQNYSLTCTTPATAAPPSGCLPSESQNSLGSPGPNPQMATYTLYVSGSTVYARNNSTGSIDFSGSDAAVVVNSVLTANTTVGGHLFFKNGVYPINSLIEDATTGCASFQGSGNKLAYAFGIPANASYATGVQWFIEGEASTIWTGELLATTVAATGVVFNVTPTAVSSVTANDVLAGFWQRPATNCALTTAITNNNSNDIYLKNITFRWPVNTRGNEIHYALYFAGDVQYENVLADYNVGYNTIATGSAPTVGSYNNICFTSTTSGAGNWEDFRQTYAVGCNIGYDFQSEHVTGTTVTAIYSNIACEFGRSAGSVFHPVHIDHFIDQENGAGCIWGANVLQGTLFDIYFDFELGTDANWYSTARNKLTALSETNNGYGTGILRYQVVQQNTGVAAEIPANTLFSSGGVNFQAIEGTAPPSFALIPISDTFTRPNSSTTAGTNGLGPMWSSGTQGSNANLKIVSNSAQVNNTGLNGGYAVYLAQPMNADQFSKSTCSTLTAATGNFCEVMVRGSTNPAVQTYYTYYEGGTAASGRGIIKVVAGVSTTLASQTASAGSAGDVMELDVVGSTLWAYRNGALDTSFPNPVTDSAITSGAPGIQEVDQTTAAVAMTNWKGGSFPTKTGTDSIYNNPGYHTFYLSTGTAPTPTGTGACATITTQVPASIGAQAGSLKCTGTTGASTITLTFPAAQAAPNGYRCSADDSTTVANKPNETSWTTTTCVLTIASVTANDVIVWNASPF